MSSAIESNTSSQQPEVDAAKTAKFLANLQRTVGSARRDPDDAPAAAPVAAPVAVAPAPKPAAVVEREIPVTRTGGASRLERLPAKRKGGDRVAVEVTLDPGTASRVVYIRVDKTLADRLALIAFQNKISGGEGPATVNDIGISALNRWLDEYEQAA
jgi:hypothetical protein